MDAGTKSSLKAMIFQPAWLISISQKAEDLPPTHYVDKSAANAQKSGSALC